MRLKYYKVTLRQMSYQKRPFVLFFILSTLLSMIFFYIFFIKRMEPTIKELCEYEARMTALEVTNSAVEKNMENITYDSLITITQDESGKVSSITANSIEINKLSGSIELAIKNELDNYHYSDMTLPLGGLLGSNLLGGYGPKIRIKNVMSGVISVKFYSDFESAGINQTKHKIILKINTKVMTIAPFYSDMQEFENEILVAETVIVGEIPVTYYNISGIENLNDEMKLELIE